MRFHQRIGVVGSSGYLNDRQTLTGTPKDFYSKEILGDIDHAISITNYRRQYCQYHQWIYQRNGTSMRRYGINHGVKYQEENLNVALSLHPQLLLLDEPRYIITNDAVTTSKIANITGKQLYSRNCFS